MNIGEAVKALQIKYPSASISRIRFLEKEGLINIKRSSGGTRKFTSKDCLLYTSPSPRDLARSRMPSSA